MVERVARGKIMVPAAAALTVMAAGALESGPAQAAGRQATLQIRVQVVEPCRIRIAPSGTLEETCGGTSAVSPPARVELGNLLGRPTLRLPAGPERSLPSTLSADRRPWMSPPGFPTPIEGGPTAMIPGRTAPSDVGARFAVANERAREVAERISRRVRFITIAY